MKSIELIFDEEKIGDGVTAISLVEKPAILVNWMAFNEDGGESKLMQFQTIDEEKRMIAGPVMIPDLDIVRKDRITGEKFTVHYKGDTIRKMSEFFIKTGKQTSTTIEHSQTLNGVSVVETWIIEDPDNDKANHYGFSLPTGTWFVVMKVDDDKVWTAVKNGVIKGFSLEGYFGEQVSEEFNEENFISMLKTNIVEAFKQVFGAQQDEQKPTDAKQFATVAVTDTEGNAVELIFTGEALAEGIEVRWVNPEGEEILAPDGVYVLEDGMLATVAGGVVTEIKEPESEEMSKPSETFSSQDAEALEAKMLQVFEKFGDLVDAKLAETEKNIKNLRLELSEIPGADSLKDTPPNTDGAPKKSSWKEFTSELKKKK